MEKFVVTNLFKAVPDPQRTRIEQALRHDMLAEPQRARMKPRDPPGNGAKGVIRYLKRGRAFVDWLDERAGEATIEDITKQFGCSRASAYRWLAAVRGSEA